MTISASAARRLALGSYGERLAERHLREQGMVLLDRNWSCDVGEIDLVLRDGDVLVICEVKTRSSVDFGGPLEAVNEVKLRRLRKLGARWLQDHRVRASEVRFDMVGVVRPRRGPAVIEHVRGIG